jgi:arginine-tRNA-protein transferase
MDKDDVGLYLELLESDFTETFLLEFRDSAGVLKIVSLIDLVEDGISAVYTFYDPDQTQNSYGTFGILSLVNIAKQMGLSYVYLGYWIEDCNKMQYKQQFSGLQHLVQNQWVDMSKK